MAQWVTDLALSLLWHESNPWPRRELPHVMGVAKKFLKKEERKKEEKKEI